MGRDDTDAPLVNVFFFLKLVEVFFFLRLVEVAVFLFIVFLAVVVNDILVVLTMRGIGKIVVLTRHAIREIVVDEGARRRRRAYKGDTQVSTSEGWVVCNW